MFNTGALSAIHSICSLPRLSFPTRSYYGKTSPRYLNEKKSSTNYILFDNNVRERVIVTRTVNDRTPSNIYYSEPISGGLYSDLETLNAHQERSLRHYQNVLRVRTGSSYSRD